MSAGLLLTEKRGRNAGTFDPMAASPKKKMTGLRKEAKKLGKKTTNTNPATTNADKETSGFEEGEDLLGVDFGFDLPRGKDVLHSAVGTDEEGGA